jgi:ATP-dependent RNA helicase DDX5/DBP2
MHKNAGTLGLDPSNMPAINKDFYKEHPEVTEMSLAEVEAYRKDAQMVISGKGVPK